MSGTTEHKRKRGAFEPKKKSKKVRRAEAYHSSSEEEEEAEAEPLQTGVFTKKAAALDAGESGASASSNSDEEDFAGIALEDEDDQPTTKGAKATSLLAADDDETDSEAPADDTSNAQTSDSPSDSDTSSHNASTTSSTTRTKPKRTDHTAFASSISAILSSKLTTTKRADPLLARSKDAAETSRSKNESQLEVAARRKLRAEKVEGREKGRVKDVLGTGSDAAGAGVSVGKENGGERTGESLQEEERRLKRTAQRGVVKLFNAVRAAQVGAIEVGDKSAKEGTVGVDRRKERVDEMSRKGFLEMLSGGGAT